MTSLSDFVYFRPENQRSFLSINGWGGFQDVLFTDYKKQINQFSKECILNAGPGAAC